VSLFRSFLIFASKRNEAKRILFRFIFDCFCETKKYFFALFRIVSLRFFFAISLQNKKHFFRYFAQTFSLQYIFFVVSLQLFHFETLFSLFRFCLSASKHFFRYFDSTFSLQYGIRFLLFPFDFFASKHFFRYFAKHLKNTTRVGTKTPFSLFAKTKTFTKSVTVFAKFRLFFAKILIWRNLVKKNSIYIIQYRYTV
jgi:hypothetical protein